LTGNKCKFISVDPAICRPQKSLREPVLLAFTKKRFFLFFVGFSSLLTTGLISGTSAHAENLSAQIFDSKKKSLLFTLKVIQTTDEPTAHYQGIYKTPDGKVSAHEELDLDHGELKKYLIEHPQTHQSGSVAIEDGKLVFSYVDGDGKTKISSEPLQANTIVPPTTADFIRSHWGDLMNGKFVDARFASADRHETIGFEFFKNGAQQYNGHDAIFIRMKATGFFISAIVKEMTFVMDRTSKKVLEFHGRLVPKDVDGIMVYSYP
jgi:hypothetical protein